MNGFFITGTDTDIGKTIVSCWLALHLRAKYWKPVQAGNLDYTDRDVVQTVTGFPDEYFHASRYELKEPLSPHEAAKREGISISLDDFSLPEIEPLIVEGAGGVMVPINSEHLVLDLIERLRLPVILVARSELGTINHTSLSLMALRSRDIKVSGVVLVGKMMPHNREAIEEYGKVDVIAEIPAFHQITRDTLRAVAPRIPINEWRYRNE